MQNFHVFQIIGTYDPFCQPLINSYDPSINLAGNEKDLLSLQMLPKVEEGTSPGYLLQQASDIFHLPEVEVQHSQIKSNRKNRRQEKDEDYRPYQWARTAKSAVVKQKQDRNLIPNTVNHLLAFVQKKFKSKYLTERIFNGANRNGNFTLARFYNFHKMLRVKINNYVNEEALRIVTEEGVLDYGEYGREEQRFYCYVSRVLIRHFLKREAVLMILLSQRVKKENLLELLSVQRYLYENMLAQGEEA